MGYKIAIVEDDELILELITNFLKLSQKFEKIVTYSDGFTFLNSIENIQKELDVILLDFRLGEINAEVILKDLQAKSIAVPVIILTSHYNQYLVSYMIGQGASAYLPKNIKPNELIEVIEEVILKGHYISAEQFPFLKIAFADDTPDLSNQVWDISEKNIEIIYLLANQLTAKEIAQKLAVSPKTVEGYKNSLFSKTNTRSVVGLILFCIQNGLISADAIDLGKKP